MLTLFIRHSPITTMLSYHFTAHVSIYLCVPLVIFNWLLLRLTRPLQEWIRYDLITPKLPENIDWLITWIWATLHVAIIGAALGAWLQARRGNPCDHYLPISADDKQPVDLLAVCQPPQKQQPPPPPAKKLNKRQRRAQYQAALRESCRQRTMHEWTVDLWQRWVGDDGDLVPTQQFHARLVMGLQALVITWALNAYCVAWLSGRPLWSVMWWRTADVDAWLTPTEWLSFVQLHVGMAAYVAWIVREYEEAEVDVWIVDGCKNWTVEMARQAGRVREHMGQEQLSLVAHWALMALWMWCFYFEGQLFLVGGGRCLTLLGLYAIGSRK